VRPDALTAPAALPEPGRRALPDLWRGPGHSELWRQAAEIRREWLDVGLTTVPADRPATEAAIAAIYALHGRRRPSFVWVASPRAALPHLAGLPTHETLRAWIRDRRPAGRPPMASEIAAGLSRLRSALADRYSEPPPERPRTQRKKGEGWPVLPPAEALRHGLPFLEIVRQGSLLRSLANGVYLPIRAAVGAPLPVGWYGHQDATWVAHFDILHRLGLAHYGATALTAHPHTGHDNPAGADHPGSPGRVFAMWQALTRSAGWWWPAEEHCILVERPAAIRFEPVPGAWHDEIRLRHDPGRPAVEYRDGWSI